LNMAVRVRTCLSPRELLTTLQTIEAEMGRERSVRWGPRVIDIDILLYEKEVIFESDLEIPHPRLTERAFVLYPLLEIDEDLCLPEGTPLRSFLASVSNQEIRMYQPDSDRL
jgi:2-amino-4-hydroxy-6-hydroxymethyldihydropteridine diphosphokinase